MVLVLALLLTALWGVHSASIPANSLGKLARKSAIKLDVPNLDKIRHTVLEDMKKLLDNQLAVLFESADQKAGAQRKLLKPKTKLRPTLNTGDTTSTLESLLPDESQNSDLIKVLTDGSLQDSGDEVLRNAVDQLLQEDEDTTAVNIDNGEELLNNNEDQLNGDNSTENNSGEIIAEDAFDDATLTPINENDSRKGKSNSKKGISHVIIEHLPKSSKKYDNDKKSENILDLDEILKSALKDISSHEDENSIADDTEGRDLATENLYPKSSKQNDSSFQVEGKINEDNSENTFKTEKYNSDRGENNVHEDSETRLDSVVEHENPTIKHHTLTHKYNINNQDHQPINDNVRSENHAINRDDIHRAGKDLTQDENDTKELKRDENEAKVIKHHNERHHSNEKSKKGYGNRRNHHNKNHHSKHRHNKNHNTHKHHNENENHDHTANQHIFVRLISDSEGSNESRLDTLHYKTPDHDEKLEKNYRHKKSKETSNHSDRYDISTLREGRVNVSQDANEDKRNIAEFKKSDRDEKENNIFEPNNDFTEADESNSEEDYYIERKHVIKEKSNENDDEKQVAKEENKSLEARITGKKENNIENEDNIGKERHKNVNYVTDEIGNITMQNPAREKASDIEDKTRNTDENDSEDKKFNTKKDKNSKKEEIHKCHLENNERIGFESGDPNVIRDLIQNNEMKKSYSLSLTLSTK